MSECPDPLMIYFNEAFLGCLFGIFKSTDSRALAFCRLLTAGIRGTLFKITTRTLQLLVKFRLGPTRGAEARNKYETKSLRWQKTNIEREPTTRTREITAQAERHKRPNRNQFQSLRKHSIVLTEYVPN